MNKNKKPIIRAYVRVATREQITGPNRFDIHRETVARVRADFPPGTRVELVKMDDPQAPPIGTKGTVLYVDDIASLCMRWDNGSSLHVAYGEDIVRKIDTPPESAFDDGGCLKKFRDD